MELVHRASEKSLAARGVAWKYTAPKELGGSSFDVILEPVEWGTPVALSISQSQDRPDAVIACNAGLAAYRSWLQPVGFCQVLKIPFAVTDYVEQSLRTARTGIMRTAWMPSIQTIHHYGMDSGYDSPDVCHAQENPIAVNPFAKPGQKVVGSYRLPSMINGFSMAVFKET
ncbi:hypothetical protein HGRIS_012995 [Hohenbuehelia grisea]|uniref:Mitochondrial splicing suppressor 51-like C-terminal domain-containing protein n=1 Tax=Hohenbuehelia grisea TaxID=104357 RepID=A0ABR3IUC9_9AGAR